MMAIFIAVFVILALVSIGMTFYFGFKSMKPTNKIISNNDAKLNAIIKKLGITLEDIENEKTNEPPKRNKLVYNSGL